MTCDTTADAFRVQIEALSRLTGAERLLQALEFSDMVLEIHEAGRLARAADRAAPGPAQLSSEDPDGAAGTR